MDISFFNEQLPISLQNMLVFAFYFFRTFGRFLVGASFMQFAW